jgi:predicted GH43/DUF377 family glycosyl hydrolase
MNILFKGALLQSVFYGGADKVCCVARANLEKFVNKLLK